MKSKRVKWAILAVPVLIALALWPMARENRRRAQIVEQQRIADLSTRALIHELNFAKPKLTNVRTLLARGADPNASTELGKHLLLRAIGEEDHSVAVVKLLLDAGADVNARSRGMTALIRAAMFANPEVVRVLLQRGAIVNARYQSEFSSDYPGATALDMAKSHLLRYEERVEDLPELHGVRDAHYFRLKKCIRLLKAAGAKE